MGRAETVRLRGARRTGLTAVIALLIVLLIGASPARADDGLIVSSTSRYVLDSEQHRVTGALTMVLRNVSPNVDTNGGGYQYYYYDAYGIPLPAEAADVEARSGDTRLRVERKPIVGQPGFRLYEIQFPDLLYGATRTIDLTFTLEGQPARSDDPTRIGPGYATFGVFGPGDPGNNTVEVVVDEDLELDSTARSFTPAPGPDGTTVYTSTEDNLAPGFSATMSVRSTSVGEGRQVTVGGVALALVPYPDDPEWADFIESRAGEGLPILSELVGQPWPGDIDRIREDAGSQVRGFDGWYSTSEREIVLGEELNDGILYHELAHAWINYSSVEDRWLSEGLAEFLAEQVSARTDGTFVRPGEVGPGDSGAVPLQTWQDSPGFRGTELDAWAYPASYKVVSSLLGDLDDTALSDLLADVVTAASPWDLPGHRELSGGQVSTKAFLDLLDAHETPTNSAASTVLYSTWVLDDADAGLLGQRALASEAFAEFARPPSWGAPLGIRRAMATWDYERATELMTRLADLPEAAATVEQLAGATDTELPSELQRDYENADNDQELALVQDELVAAMDALVRYQEARAAADADRGLFGRIGARVLNIEDTANAAQQNISVRDYASSESASQLTLERADSAERTGAILVAGALVGLLVLAMLVTLLVRALRRRRRRSRVGHPMTASSSSGSPEIAPESTEASSSTRSYPAGTPDSGA